MQSNKERANHGDPDNLGRRVEHQVRQAIRRDLRKRGKDAEVVVKRTLHDLRNR